MSIWLLLVMMILEIKISQVQHKLFLEDVISHAITFFLKSSFKKDGIFKMAFCRLVFRCKLGLV